MHMFHKISATSSSAHPKYFILKSQRTLSCFEQTSLQETTLDCFSSRCVQSQWRCQQVDWCYLASIRASGKVCCGTKWRWRNWRSENYVGWLSHQNGKNGSSNFETVYGPNCDQKRRFLWDLARMSSCVRCGSALAVISTWLASLVKAQVKLLILVPTPAM